LQDVVQGCGWECHSKISALGHRALSRQTFLFVSSLRDLSNP
jgi:hypothetical protein